MATVMVPQTNGDRPVIRCDHCHLMQFVPSNGLCRRCKASLIPEPESSVAVPGESAARFAAPQPAPPLLFDEFDQLLDSLSIGPEIAANIAKCRHAAGLSQRELALRMCVPRTYVSKIENRKAIPTIPSLLKISAALNVRPACIVDTPKHDSLLARLGNELLADPFIRELWESGMPKFDDDDRKSIFAMVTPLPGEELLKFIESKP